MDDSVPLLTRAQNAHIRALLRDRHVRAQEGAFVVEGAHAVCDLVARYPDQIISVVTARGYQPKEGAGGQLARLAAAGQHYACPDVQFSKLSETDAPQGILAVVKQPVWDEAAVLSRQTVLGVFGEQLQDPANVGAIIRTAAALNVSALWLTPESADVYHPKVVRATSGALLALPIFFTKDLSGVIRQGCRIFSAEVAGDGVVPIGEIHRLPRKFVFAVGNESRGLSAQIRSQATTRFTIPLSRGVESLNVAASVAIATFYFSRLPQEP